MSDEVAITHWLKRLQAGDLDGARVLWDAYFHKMLVLARRTLEGRNHLLGDEEDIALSAFQSFCRALQERRFPELHDREELWRLLVTITLRKSFRLVRDESRLKRGGSRKRSTTALPDDAQLDQLVSREPSPQLAAQFAEECRRLLDLLPADQLELAVWKLEGFTNEEIAAKWGKAERTVERKLKLIRETWESQLRPED